MRLALKLATGAGKTTVMAMLIAWQTINAVRRPSSKQFTRGFLVVTPGLTIRDRLRVLQPNDPDSYYAEPRAGARATCSATSSGPRSSSPTTTPSSCASGWSSRRAGARCCRAAGEALNTLETEGQMLQRVMPDLMGMKNILVLNDEAHHCYREKPERRRRRRSEGRREEGSREEQRGRAPLDLRPRGRQPQARRRPRHRPLGDAVLPARLGLRRGHALPLDDERLLADGRHRVRHRQAAARAGGRQHPRRRDADVPQPLGAHRQEDAEEGPGQGRRRSTRSACPSSCRPRWRPSTATTRRPSSCGRRAGIRVPPCFIVVCNNTSTSKLVYDYISGFQRENEDGSTTLENGRLALFRNFDEHGNPLARPQHAADRQRAARIRRGARRQLPRDGRRRDRALPPRDRRAHRRPRSRPRTSPTRTCCARS